MISVRFRAQRTPTGDESQTLNCAATPGMAAMARTISGPKLSRSVPRPSDPGRFLGISDLQWSSDPKKRSRCLPSGRMPGRKVAAGTLVVLWGLVSLTHPAKSESALPNAARSTTTTTTASRPQKEELGISSNPAATNAVTGTGWLGEQLGIDNRGVPLGGVWVGGVNDLVTGASGLHLQQLPCRRPVCGS